MRALRCGPGAIVDSADGQPQTEDHSDPTACVGAILAGKYKQVEASGEGGMGSVFPDQRAKYPSAGAKPREKKWRSV